jgi:nitrile hydratase accessory protein
MTGPADAAAAALPPDVDAPPFPAPWQAEAFALTVALHRAGAFAWTEWAAALSAAIARAPAADGETADDAYWRQWLAALDDLLADRGLVEAAALADRIEAWRQAYAATPHGEPVVLGE